MLQLIFSGGGNTPRLEAKAEYKSQVFWTVSQMNGPCTRGAVLPILPFFFRGQTFAIMAKTSKPIRFVRYKPNQRKYALFLIYIYRERGDVHCNNAVHSLHCSRDSLFILNWLHQSPPPPTHTLPNLLYKLHVSPSITPHCSTHPSSPSNRSLASDRARLAVAPLVLLLS